MKNVSYGIDFGTTNSAVSFVSNSHTPELISLNKNQHNTIPTTIFFPSKNTQSPLFGDQAIDAYILGDDGRFMRSIKRILGTDLMNSSTIIQYSSMDFSEIIKIFIEELKKQADEYVKIDVKNVSIGRPVRFSDDDRYNHKAQDFMEKIAKNAGFENITFQYEPIAAAYAHESQLTEEKLAFVIDIGGGTSDFSIIRLGPNNKNKVDRSDDILANTGVCIGGNDIDKAFCIKSFMPEFGSKTTYGGQGAYDKILPVPNLYFHSLAEWSKVNMMYNYNNITQVKKIFNQSNAPEKYRRLVQLFEDESAHLLLNAVEKSKIELSDKEEIAAMLDFIDDNPEILLSKKEFESSIAKDISYVERKAKECLGLAGIDANKIELLILTGGSTEIPYVQEKMKKICPNALISGYNKLSSVGLGLGFDAKKKFG